MKIHFYVVLTITSMLLGRNSPFLKTASKNLEHFESYKDFPIETSDVFPSDLFVEVFVKLHQQFEERFKVDETIC